jgi:hypothetical protein
MDVGRWYKDNSGEEFRYIGSTNDDESIGLFSDGEKTFKKSLSDFENVPKEKKLFGFFKKGGITANDLLEARSFFGEGEWKKLTREDRIKSARYLKRTGKIGYKKGGKINQGDLPDFISMQYDKGGKMGRYTVNVYYGGEMENEEIYTDSLSEAKKISQRGEHSEIYDNVKKVFIEEYAKGGIVTKSKVIAELQKLGFGKEKAENLLEKHIDIYEINEDDEDAKTIALQIEEQYNQEYGKGGTIDEMVASLRKQKEDLKEQYKNAQMDGINTDKLLVKIQKVNNELNSALKQMFSSIKLSDGGELDEEDSLDYNSISDLQSERNRLVRWKYQYNNKGADYKIKQLEERIEYLKSKDKMSKGGKVRTPEDFKMLRRRKMSKGGTLDYSKISNIEVEGIDKNDYPDFSDAYIYYAEYDGEPMTDKQIEELNENGEFVYEQIHRRLYARGGMLKDNLEKELNRLLRQINSPRLSVYTKGDTSEEEMSRRRERASKIARKDEILRVLNEMDSKMAKGGRTKFQDKADAIADSLEGKKVAPKYRKQYGAKYDRSEAEMAGKRIAGAMRKKYGI